MLMFGAGTPRSSEVPTAISDRSDSPTSSLSTVGTPVDQDEGSLDDMDISPHEDPFIERDVEQGRADDLPLSPRRIEGMSYPRHSPAHYNERGSSENSTPNGQSSRQRFSRYRDRAPVLDDLQIPRRSPGSPLTANFDSANSPTDWPLSPKAGVLPVQRNSSSQPSLAVRTPVSPDLDGTVSGNPSVALALVSASRRAAVSSSIEIHGGQSNPPTGPGQAILDVLDHFNPPQTRASHPLPPLDPSTPLPTRAERRRNSAKSPVVSTMKRIFSPIGRALDEMSKSLMQSPGRTPETEPLLDVQRDRNISPLAIASAIESHTHVKDGVPRQASDPNRVPGMLPTDLPSLEDYVASPPHVRQAAGLMNEDIAGLGSPTKKGGRLRANLSSIFGNGPSSPPAAPSRSTYPPPEPLRLDIPPSGLHIYTARSLEHAARPEGQPSTDAASCRTREVNNAPRLSWQGGDQVHDHTYSNKHRIGEALTTSGQEAIPAGNPASTHRVYEWLLNTPNGREGVDVESQFGDYASRYQSMRRFHAVSIASSRIDNTSEDSSGMRVPPLFSGRSTHRQPQHGDAPPLFSGRSAYYGDQHTDVSALGENIGRLGATSSITTRDYEDAVLSQGPEVLEGALNDRVPGASEHAMVDSETWSTGQPTLFNPSRPPSEELQEDDGRPKSSREWLAGPLQQDQNPLADTDAIPSSEVARASGPPGNELNIFSARAIAEPDPTSFLVPKSLLMRTVGLGVDFPCSGSMRDRTTSYPGPSSNETTLHEAPFDLRSQSGILAEEGTSIRQSPLFPVSAGQLLPQIPDTHLSSNFELDQDESIGSQPCSFESPSTVDETRDTVRIGRGDLKLSDLPNDHQWTRGQDGTETSADSVVITRSNFPAGTNDRRLSRLRRRAGASNTAAASVDVDGRTDLERLVEARSTPPSPRPAFRDSDIGRADNTGLLLQRHTGAIDDSTAALFDDQGDGEIEDSTAALFNHEEDDQAIEDSAAALFADTACNDEPRLVRRIQFGRAPEARTERDKRWAFTPPPEPSRVQQYFLNREREFREAVRARGQMEKMGEPDELYVSDDEIEIDPLADENFSPTLLDSPLSAIIQKSYDMLEQVKRGAHPALKDNAPMFDVSNAAESPPMSDETRKVISQSVPEGGSTSSASSLLPPESPSPTLPQPPTTRRASLRGDAASISTTASDKQRRLTALTLGGSKAG